jgi:hypothetical protein
VLVVQKDGPDTGASLPPLQKVEESAARTVEYNREGNWIERGMMQVLHVYLDRESQHRLMSCMRMKTCMKMVAV